MKPVYCGKGRRHLRNIFVFNFALREIVLSVAYKTTKYVKRVCEHCTIASNLMFIDLFKIITLKVFTE